MAAPCHPTTPGNECPIGPHRVQADHRAARGGRTAGSAGVTCYPANGTPRARTREWPPPSQSMATQSPPTTPAHPPPIDRNDPQAARGRPESSAPMSHSELPCLRTGSLAVPSPPPPVHSHGQGKPNRARLVPRWPLHTARRNVLHMSDRMHCCPLARDGPGPRGRRGEGDNDVPPRGGIRRCASGDMVPLPTLHLRPACRSVLHILTSADSGDG